MTLEILFEKFDLFADAPDAVAAMRELLLQLAVTGKLVLQDKRDESASSLLASAEAQRTKLVAARRIKVRPTADVEPDEQPFEVPSNWVWARLLDVGYELGQKVPDKRFTYIDVGSIDSDKGLISHRVEKLEPNEAPSRARKIVARGTVIYSTVRPYLLNTAIVDQDFDPEPIASTAFGILHPFVGFNNRYLLYWLRSAPFTAYVQEAMKGMAYPAINEEKFYSGFIAVPPVAEQKRIVTKVDELMALCDRLEAHQQERETRHEALAGASLARFADAPTRANLNLLFHNSYDIPPADLRQAILSLAVQGKLVSQEPNDGTAESTLPKLAAVAVKSESDFGPAHWLRVPLGRLGEWRGGGTPSKSRTDYWEGSMPWVSPKDMKVLRIADAQDHISEAAVEGSSVRKIPTGSLLMVVRGMILARAFPVAITTREVTINQDMKALLPLEAETAEFLLVALRAFEPDVLAAIERSTHGTCKLQTEVLEAFLIPIPPVAEQRRIVAKVDELMALADALETQIAAARTTATKLVEAFVAELKNKD
jgi:type I restriction enzyme S subunit